MKAAVNRRYGPPSIIAIESIEKPQPKPNEILIKVHYSSVNRTDCGFLRAKPFITRLFTGLFKPKYVSLGYEFSGVVEDLGKGVTEYIIGDTVFGFDDVAYGGHSEYKCIDVSKTVQKIPEGVSLRDAGISTEGAHYALYYLYVIKPQKGTRVFLNGATGGIGSAALQLLKDKGAYVCATSTTDQIDMVKKLGADEVIDWQKTDLANHKGQYDAFFDAVGKSSFGFSKKLLKPGGVYVSSELGKFGQNPLLSLINPIQRLLTKRDIAFPIPLANKREVMEIARVLKSGAFKPVIDREYPLEQIVEAYEYVESGNKVGNVVIKVN